ncbi:MAG: S8 family serine peptidase, partial [Bacteroidota bacterium]
FDGTGVNLGVIESNNVDSAENPNYRSRLVRTYETGSTPNSHKTNVTNRVAKAGNIDPREQGIAYGAHLYSYSGGLQLATMIPDEIVNVNRSISWGIPSGTQSYNTTAREYDNAMRLNPNFMVTHSVGNDGDVVGYTGLLGWGNVGGLAKMAKNILNVGASDHDGSLMFWSARGPAVDGHLLPHIVAPGPSGTSFASPNLVGVYGQLEHAYRFHNNNVKANSGLLKAVMLNTADDMLNPGPDFKSGFGHVNARRAYEVIRQGQYLSGTIAQGGNNSHTINVPANVRELKVMVYWNDYEATAGISTRVLVNDLDVELTAPNNSVYLPWILDPTFNAVNLDAPATRGVDMLNNQEQVTLQNPAAGAYQLAVKGTAIPQGPQTYFMTYEFITDEIVVTHPHGGEKFVPNETERIRWDACDSTLTFDIAYSTNAGTSWNTIATGVDADSRFHDWQIPAGLTDEALIRVERGGTACISDTSFTISQQPDSMELRWSCADSSMFRWNAFPNADGYEVYRIIGDYMSFVTFTNSNVIVLNGLSPTESEYVSIALVQNGVTSRRIVALERAPGDLNCNAVDIGALEILNPGAAHLPECIANQQPIKIKVRNWGLQAVDSVPISYRINGGAIQHDTIFTTIPAGTDQEFSFSGTPGLAVGSNLVEA